MAAFGQTEGSFECPVCGAACQAVFAIRLEPPSALSGSGARAEATVNVKTTKLMGCPHVEAFRLKDA